MRPPALCGGAREAPASRRSTDGRRDAPDAPRRAQSGRRRTAAATPAARETTMRYVRTLTGLLTHSCALTLALKYKLRYASKVYKKFGKSLNEPCAAAQRPMRSRGPQSGYVAAEAAAAERRRGRPLSGKGLWVPPYAKQGARPR